MPLAPLKRCTLYIPGHSVHWIQAIHSANEPRQPRHGVITRIKQGVVTADFDGAQRRYRNHETRRLRAVIDERGSRAVVDEGWSILKVPGEGGAYCFSIADADEAWCRCRYDVLCTFDDESLGRRIRTHGGFTVSGARLVGAAGNNEQPLHHPDSP